MNRIRISDIIILFSIQVAVWSGVFLLLITGAMSRLSGELPLNDPIWDYSCGVYMCILLNVFIICMPFHPKERVALLILWAVKIFVVLCLMPFYENFYGSNLDAFVYFQEGYAKYPEGIGLELGKGTENIISIISFLSRVIPESYHALKAFFGFVGLMGIFFFYRSATIFLNRNDLRLLYFLGIFPSIIFWSSILGKDPFIVLSLGLYSFGIVSWMKRNQYKGIGLVFIALLMSIYIRPWMVIIMVLPITIVLLIFHRKIKHGVLICAICIALLIAGIFQIKHIFEFENARTAFDAATTWSQAWAEGGSANILTVDLSDPINILLHFPLAAFTALFRPLPGEVPNIFGMLAGLENIVLLAMMYFALRRFKKSNFSNPIIMWILSFILVWTVFYSFISYQNMGTAVRFRIQVLPFVLGFFLLLHRQWPLWPISLKMIKKRELL